MDVSTLPTNLLNKMPLSTLSLWLVESPRFGVNLICSRMNTNASIIGAPGTNTADMKSIVQQVPSSLKVYICRKIEIRNDTFITFTQISNRCENHPSSSVWLVNDLANLLVNKDCELWVL